MGERSYLEVMCNLSQPVCVCQGSNSSLLQSSERTGAVLWSGGGGWFVSSGWVLRQQGRHGKSLSFLQTVSSGRDSWGFKRRNLDLKLGLAKKEFLLWSHVVERLFSKPLSSLVSSTSPRFCGVFQELIDTNWPCRSNHYGKFMGFWWIVPCQTLGRSFSSSHLMLSSPEPESCRWPESEGSRRRLAASTSRLRKECIHSWPSGNGHSGLYSSLNLTPPISQKGKGNYNFKWCWR